MFCNNCGTQLPDGLKFCTVCGAPVGGSSPEPQPQQQFQTQPEPQPQFQPQQQQFQQQQFQQQQFQQQFQQPNVCANCGAVIPDGCTFCTTCGTPVNSGVMQSAPTKKKRKKWPVFVALGAVAAIVGTTLAVNASSVGNFFRKNFSKPESYYSYVEGKSVKASISDVMDAFEEAQKTANTSGKGSVNLKLESGGRKLLASALGGMDDLEWLESIGMSFDVATKNQQVSEKVTLDLNGSDLLSMDLAIDSENLLYFFRIPELCDSYLGIDMTSMMQDTMDGMKNNMAGGGMTISPSNFNAFMNGLSAALPDADETEEFLNRYVDVFLDNLGDVSKKSDSLEIDGISEKCTVLSVTLTEKDCINLAKAFLKEVRKDSYVKNLVTDLSDLFVSMSGMGDAEIGDVYAQFQSVIDMALEELENTEVSDEENSLCMDVYVNGSGEVLGRSLSLTTYGETQELFSYGTVKKGDKVAFKAEIPAANCMLTGSGTESKSLFNGKYELIVSGLSVANMEVVNFNMDDFEDGKLNGTLKLSSSQLAGFSLDLAFNSKKDTSDMKATVMSGSSPLFSLTVQSEPSDYSFQGLPDMDDCYDVSDENDLMEFVQNIKWDTLINNLKNSDIPSEYTDMIESSIEQMLYFME